MDTDFDLLVIGPGINGCGIAREAAAPGLCVGLKENRPIRSLSGLLNALIFGSRLRVLLS